MHGGSQWGCSGATVGGGAERNARTCRSDFEPSASLPATTAHSLCSASDQYTHTHTHVTL